MEFVIDEEFKALIPPLTEEEFNQLRMNIIADGCRDPLTVWEEEGLLLDGHNRHEICIEHDIDFNTVELSFDNREEVCDWMDANQLGRRNLSPDDRREMLGRRYNRRKKPVPNPSGIGGKSGKIDEPQNGVQQNTAEKLAEEHGVSKNTVQRAGEFAAEVEKVKEESEGLEREEVFKQAKDNIKDKKREEREAKAKLESSRYCMGMQMARIAVQKLEQIQPDDMERDQAFQTVEEYINEKR